MQITILALGSRGDVQPFVALALGLQAAGHCVRVAAAADYASLAEPYGMPFTSVGGAIADLMDRELVYGILDAPGNPLRFAHRMVDALRPVVRRLLADCLEACRGAEALVVSSLGVYAGYDMSEALGIPLYPAHMHPYGSTSAWQHVFFPALPAWVPLRRIYNLLTHRLGEVGFWQFLSGILNEARRDLLGLRPLPPGGMLARARTQFSPVLLAYSSLVAPKPRDWSSAAHVTGYWFLDRPASWQPPPELVDFLEAGPPPVFVTFGSNLAGRDPDAITGMIVRALRRTGQRGILASGWGDLGNISLPASVLKTGAVPHDWLFPRVAAVVCHAGAGTTAAALRAGAPLVPVPFFGDQRFWARRIYRLGAAAKPVPRAELTEDRLAKAIAVADGDRSIRARAMAIGSRVSSEQGVARAVELIERGVALCCT